MNRWGWTVIVTVAVAGCGPSAETGGPESDFQGLSLLGDSLFAKHDHDEEIALADEAAAANPADVELLIGAARVRRNDFRYREMVEMYTRAVELAPDDWRPLRFRGHRYISLRQFDDAIPDLERARDVAPLNFDVSYHLGLAYFLAGRFDEAADEYVRCLDLATSPDAVARSRSGQHGTGFRSCVEIADREATRVAATEWAYRSLIRADRESEAARLLETIEPGWEPDANLAYYHQLLAARGILSDDELLAGTDEYRFETVAFGVANRRLAAGDTAAALPLLTRIVDDPHWPGFGRIAAEVELARLR